MGSIFGGSWPFDLFMVFLVTWIALNPLLLKKWASNLLIRIHISYQSNAIDAGGNSGTDYPHVAKSTI